MWMLRSSGWDESRPSLPGPCFLLFPKQCFFHAPWGSLLCCPVTEILYHQSWHCSSPATNPAFHRVNFRDTIFGTRKTLLFVAGVPWGTSQSSWLSSSQRNSSIGAQKKVSYQRKVSGARRDAERRGPVVPSQPYHFISQMNFQRALHTLPPPSVLLSPNIGSKSLSRANQVLGLKDGEDRIHPYRNHQWDGEKLSPRPTNVFFCLLVLVSEVDPGALCMQKPAPYPRASFSGKLIPPTLIWCVVKVAGRDDMLLFP